MSNMQKIYDALGLDEGNPVLARFTIIGMNTELSELRKQVRELEGENALLKAGAEPKPVGTFTTT